MSDTPKTDQHVRQIGDDGLVYTAFARTLERENAALRLDLERKQRALDELIACYDHKNFKPGYMQRREDAWQAARLAAAPVPAEGE